MMQNCEESEKSSIFFPISTIRTATDGAKIHHFRIRVDGTENCASLVVLQDGAGFDIT